MRLKIFTAATVPDAMHKVRNTLGEDAIILATQENENGEISITAASDDRALEEFPAETAAADHEPMDELSAALDYHRVPPELRQRLLDEAGATVSATSSEALAGAIAAVCKFSALPERPLGKPLMLVGAPGSGKTVVLAKLALHARLTGYDCRFVTLDVEKAGGLAQIQAFARAFDAEVETLADPADLSAAVARLGSETQLLIDTPGLNPFDEAQVAGLLQAAADANCEPLAVLAAGGDALETADTALAFAAFGAECLIATKIDATRRIGGILGAAYASGLAFLAASASPRIGDGLTPMSAAYLTDLLLPRAQDPAAGRSAKGIAP